MEELLEVLTWAQLGIHDKPVGLLNVNGYYNYFLTFIDRAVDDGFIKPSQHHIFVSAPNAKELVHKLEVLLLDSSSSSLFLQQILLMCYLCYDGNRDRDLSTAKQRKKAGLSLENLHPEKMKVKLKTKMKLILKIKVC